MGDLDGREKENAAGRDTGRMVGGYRLVRSLGRGGFGEVFLGEAPDGGRAAVKVLHAGWAGDPEMRRRFAAEVEQARRVSGFCVAAIVDADTQGSEPWIATEFIDGPTLQAAVAEEGPRSGVELHRLAVSTATALAAIHAAGVVHRDLKPDNIMLAPDGPRVIDFGIARAVEATSVTASGIVGTVGYMAPEQLEGLRLTSAVDIFSWGSVMVYAATGREAFPGPTQASRIARVLSGEPDLDGVPHPLAATLRVCLDKRPGHRPDARTLLDHLVTGTPMTSTCPAGIEPDGPVRPVRIGALPTPVERPLPSLPHGTPPSPPAHVVPASSASGAAGAPDAHPVDAPPHHFAGLRFTRVGDLAAAMQEHWREAVQVFSDPIELGALGSWVVNDLNDTLVDRSLFRRRVTDANMAVASFVAQARPDLPPRFRGHEVTLTGLRRLLRDPRPLVSGDRQANELMMVSRPEVLRQMAAHRGGDGLRELADQVEEAERVGLSFHRELTGALVGWRGTRVRVDSAVALAFLLDPDLVVPPEPGDLPGVGIWLGILWKRVEKAPTDTARAGYAAAVYGFLPTITELARQRLECEHRQERHRREEAELRSSGKNRGRLRNWAVVTGVSFLPLMLLGGAFNVSGVSGVGGLLLSLGLLCLLVFPVLLLAIVVFHGDRARRAEETARSSALSMTTQALGATLRTMDADLHRAREICGA
ncbi:serine/threonine-protein kinase [Nocardiopsis sp. ATB16-24]|uniref:serine/threonine protein kinase n=1 Tax=Nocardiopsis sp. ATB16-24 TaxID=3019555 RepID=UPI002556912F|nr:serine/threonine-protein kinase [Nocardiopsis sp. ATB16-24]